ncbi:MAG: Arc family DNA-binding protein [Rhodospirillaceae bacterium]|nr:Arc family DNA-binding protein [Rhodospirillaceae bacterium]
MSSLTVRNLAPSVKAKLRVRAAQNGRSMEEEVRTILKTAVQKPAANDAVTPGKALYDSIRKRVARYGSVELELPKRELPRPPPSFDE